MNRGFPIILLSFGECLALEEGLLIRLGNDVKIYLDSILGEKISKFYNLVVVACLGLQLLLLETS